MDKLEMNRENHMKEEEIRRKGKKETERHGEKRKLKGKGKKEMNYLFL
jgi:hypothetical protein